jgi:hypothetical protein
LVAEKNQRKIYQKIAEKWRNFLKQFLNHNISLYGKRMCAAEFFRQNTFAWSWQHWPGQAFLPKLGTIPEGAGGAHILYSHIWEKRIDITLYI